MQLSIDSEHQQFQSRAAALCDEILVPGAASFEQEEGVPAEVYRRLGGEGLMAVNVASDVGGSSAGVLAYSLAMTEIAKGCASTAVTMAVTNMVGEVVAHFGTAEQRELVNPALAAGDLGAFALSEVGAGSDPGGMRTTAVRDGDEWVINGTKQWISHGDTSRFIVLWARTGEQGPRGLSCFLLDGETPGLSVSGHEDKMGLRASHTVGLVMEGVRVHNDRLLGGEGGGFPIAMMALDGGRIGIASQAVGIGLRATECARDYLRQRPDIRDEQGMLWDLADNVTELEAARLLTLRAATLKEAGRPFSQEASMAKVYATEAAWKAAMRAVDMTVDAPDDVRAVAERCLRDARVTRIYEGTSEVQRIVISRSLLR